MVEVLNPLVEARRRRYLELMGLEAYYARKALENAGPSPVFAPEPVAEESASSASVSDPEAARTSVPPAQAAQAQRPASAVPPRRLFFKRVDSSLAVLSQDSWEGEEGAACLDLLRNILSALGKTFDDAGPAAPVIFGRPAGGTPEQGASFDELCQRERCDNLLIFAHNGGELFPEVSPSATNFKRSIGGVSLRVTLTRGLREMLAFPALKRHCWRDLQPLRRRLSEIASEQAAQGGE